MIQTVIEATTFSVRKSLERENRINFNLNFSTTLNLNPSTENDQVTEVSESEVKKRLESTGFRIGWSLSERWVFL